MRRPGRPGTRPGAGGGPGWHLECSVMSIAELGETLDIHLGGEDLIFPHHEDEIAQSEGVTGKTFVRYWLHVKHLLLEGQKMSKSLGNTVSVGDLIPRGYDPAAIRHQLLSAQYRRELNFTMEGLEGSARAVQRLLDFEARLAEVPVSGMRPEHPDSRAGRGRPGSVPGGDGRRPELRRGPGGPLHLPERGECGAGRVWAPNPARGSGRRDRGCLRTWTRSWA